MTLKQKREIVQRFKDGESIVGIGPMFVVEAVIRDYMNGKFGRKVPALDLVPLLIAENDGLKADVLHLMSACITDSEGNTWTSVAEVNVKGGAHRRVFRCGTRTITVDLFVRKEAGDGGV